MKALAAAIAAVAVLSTGCVTTRFHPLGPPFPAVERAQVRDHASEGACLLGIIERDGSMMSDDSEKEVLADAVAEAAPRGADTLVRRKSHVSRVDLFEAYRTLPPSKHPAPPGRDAALEGLAALAAAKPSSEASLRALDAGAAVDVIRVRLLGPAAGLVNAAELFASDWYGRQRPAPARPVVIVEGVHGRLDARTLALGGRELLITVWGAEPLSSMEDGSDPDADDAVRDSFIDAHRHRAVFFTGTVEWAADVRPVGGSDAASVRGRRAASTPPYSAMDGGGRVQFDRLRESLLLPAARLFPIDVAAWLRSSLAR